MKNWLNILKSDKPQSSETVKTEIEKLENSRQKMKADLIELESSLGDLQQDLLAELPGSLDAVRAAESHISENRNKIAGTASVIKSLEKKVAEAVANEQATRQTEIKQEIASIDDEVLELHQKIIKHFSAAAILVNKLHGNERVDQNLGYDYFLRCNLSTELNRQIAAGVTEQQGVSIYTRREQASKEKCATK